LVPPFRPHVSTLNFRLLMAILFSAYIHRPTSLTVIISQFCDDW
jgi:hypothetical protein